MVSNYHTPDESDKKSNLHIMLLHQKYKTNSVIAMTMLTGEDTLDYLPHLMKTRTDADTTGANSYRITTFNQTLERCDIGNK